MYPYPCNHYLMTHFNNFLIPEFTLTQKLLFIFLWYGIFNLFISMFCKLLGVFWGFVFFNIIALQCCVSFYYTTLWISHMYTYKASLVAQRLKRLPPMWENLVQSLGQEDPLEKEMATHSSILAWRIPWRNLVGYSTRGRTDTTEWLHLLTLKE